MSTCHPHQITDSKCRTCGKHLDQLLGEQVVFGRAVDEAAEKAWSELQNTISKQHYAELHARNADEYAKAAEPRNKTLAELYQEALALEDAEAKALRESAAFKVIQEEMVAMGVTYPNAAADLVLRKLMEHGLIEISTDPKPIKIPRGTGQYWDGYKTLEVDHDALAKRYAENPTAGVEFVGPVEIEPNGKRPDDQTSAPQRQEAP